MLAIKAVNSHHPPPGTLVCFSRGSHGLLRFRRFDLLSRVCMISVQINVMLFLINSNYCCTISFLPLRATDISPPRQKHSNKHNDTANNTNTTSPLLGKLFKQVRARLLSLPLSLSIHIYIYIYIYIYKQYYYYYYY